MIFLIVLSLILGFVLGFNNGECEIHKPILFGSMNIKPNEFNSEIVNKKSGLVKPPEIKRNLPKPYKIRPNLKVPKSGLMRD